MNKFSIEMLESMGLTREEAEDIFNKDKDLYAEKENGTPDGCKERPVIHNIDLVKYAPILDKPALSLLSTMNKISKAEDGLTPSQMGCILSAIVGNAIRRSHCESDKLKNGKIQCAIIDMTCERLQQLKPLLSGKNSISGNFKEVIKKILES